jgi:hypothetical protein
VIGELHHFVGQKLKRPAGSSRRWGGAGGGHQKRLLLARQLAGDPRARLLAQRPLQIRLHQAALGPVNRRSRDLEGRRDNPVADAIMRRQQDLRV